MTEIQRQLFSMQDEGYRVFNCGLLPTVDPARVIGVRVPQLRGYAKRIKGTPEAEAFLSTLPHAYFEEDNLHACLIEGMRDFDECMAALEAFLPYVDNWGTCDMMSPKVFTRNLPALEAKIRQWLRSGHTYTVRYGLGMLMRHFLGEHFRPEYLALAAGVQSGEYYVHMMQAWYFATALAFQYDQTLPYLAEGRLSDEVHNRAIQKAIESRRITEQQKACLAALRRRKG